MMNVRYLMLSMGLTAIIGCAGADRSEPVVQTESAESQALGLPRVTLHAEYRTVALVSKSLSDQIGRPVVLDAVELFAVGIDPDMRITLHLDDLAVPDALDAFGQALGGDLVPMDFIDTDAAILVTTLQRAHAMTPLVTHEYDLRPLIRDRDSGSKRARVESIMRIVRDIAGGCNCDIGAHRQREMGYADGRLSLAVLPEEHREVAAVLDAMLRVMRREERQIVTGPADTDAARKTRERLQQFVAVDWEGIGIANAFKDLTARKGVRFAPQWSELAAHGVDPGSTVSLRLTRVPVNRLLELILESGRIEFCSWVDREGVVIVSSPTAIPRAGIVMGVYGVGDLIDRSAKAEREAAPSPSDLSTEFDALAVMLRDRVDTDSWREVGGQEGQMWSVADMLIVRANRENHTAIRRELEKMPVGSDPHAPECGI